MNADKTKAATTLGVRSVFTPRVKPATDGEAFPICVDLRPSAVSFDFFHIPSDAFLRFPRIPENEIMLHCVSNVVIITATLIRFLY